MKNLINSIVSITMPKKAKIPEEYLAEFKLDVVSANIERDRLLALILILIDIVMFLFDIINSLFLTSNLNILGNYDYYRIVLFFISVSFLAFASSGRIIICAGNVKLYKAVHIFALTISMSLSALVSAKSDILPLFSFIISMFCVASLIIMDSFLDYIIYGVSFAIYAVIMESTGLDIQRLDNYLAFLAVLMGLAVIFSVIIVTQYKISFMDRKLILEKNLELNSLSTLLIRSNAVLRAQLETSIDGIIVIDKNNRILCYNQKFMEMLGLTSDIMKYRDGMRVFQYFIDSLCEVTKSREKLAETFLNSDKACFEKIKLKNGTILDIYTMPILYFSEEYGKVWYVRDITEKEKMLEVLRLGSELNERLLLETQKYDELKNEFFVNISHEFRTPLNVILGTLQLMEHFKSDKHESETSSRINKHLGSMRQNCFRLLRLTNNLIDMTRIDTGFYEINLQYFNIVEIVEEITLSVADFIENKGIELIFDTDVEEKVIAVDADKVERIMLNLLSNAVKFTRQSGMITVSIHDKGQSVEISVKDTGIGIPEDKQAIIFERFRQVNSSLTRDHEGSGIGLSLTKNLVELHGGSISVVSKVGSGSEFIIELPCREIAGEIVDLRSVYTDRSYVERINIEFSDIYSIS